MRTRPICVLCLFLMLGIWAADLLGLSVFRERPLSAGLEKEVLGEQVVVQGILKERTEREENFSICLTHTFLIFHSKKIPINNLKIYMEELVALPLGTQAEIRGILKEIEGPSNPGEFDSKLYCETQGIYYQMSQGELLRYSRGYSRYQEAVSQVKERLIQCFQEIAGKHAGVFQAMILGDKSNLDESIKSQYQLAGIIHILAISGLHLSVLGSGLYRLMKRLGAGNGLAGVVSLMLILQYGVLTGESVATMRAVTMFLMGIGAKMLGRCYDLLTAMSMAAILILLECPACLYYSGFLLSFGAVLGLGWILPVLEAAFSGIRLLKPFLGAASVNLVMVPLLLYFFSEVSLLGLLLNLLVIPTVAAVLASGVGGALAGLIFLPLGKLLILPGRVLLELYDILGTLCCRLPFCSWVGGKPQLWQMTVYYGILILAVEGLRRVSREQVRRPALVRGLWVCTCLLSLNFLGWKDREGLRITCLDVGQGDAIVWEKEGGECYLMDGGSTSQSQCGIYQILPYVKSRGISRITAAFITHTDEDYYNGIAQILEAQIAHTTSVRIQKLILPAWKSRPKAYRDLEALAKKVGISVEYLKKGDVMVSGELRLRFLQPEQENDLEDINGGSLVAEMEYGNFRGMFTGDTGEEQELEILEELHPCTYLKVAHHGSKNSSCEEFLKRVKPKLSVVSVARNNLYHHPHPDTMERLRKWSSQIYMTKDKGAVMLWTDGDTVRAKGFQHKEG